MAYGRPREFDIDEAVATALPIFMAKGYEGATFGELIAAMNIKPPSFYAAFGNKEGLFHKAMELYAKRSESLRARAMAQPTAYAALEALLRLSAEAYTDPNSSPGCLFVQGALVCSDKAIPVREYLRRARFTLASVLQERLERAHREGDESVAGDPLKIARFISSLVSGMAVQAVGGASREELHDIADTALQGFTDPGTALAGLALPRN